MVGNLAKSPLAALFFGALFWFVAAGPLPYSQAYLEATAAFSMPLLGFLYLIAFALWTTLIFALIFSFTKLHGVKLILLLTAVSWGLQWGVPLARQLIQGETTGVMTLMDTVWWLASGCVCTALLLTLLFFLYKLPARPEEPETQEGKEQEKKEKKQPKKTSGKEDGESAPPRKYQLKIPALIGRMLVLPFLFLVMYYLLWYFLLWRSEAVRGFYGSTERLRLVEEMVSILINRGFDAVVVLIQGFAYAAFSLLLALILLDRRVIYLVVNLMFYLSGALFYLIPSPFMPQEVRMPHLIEGAALCAAYAIATGLLIHTCWKKNKEVEEEQPKDESSATGPAKKGARRSAAAKAKQEPEAEAAPAAAKK